VQEKRSEKEKTGKISKPQLTRRDLPFAPQPLCEIKNCPSFMRRKWWGGENSFIAAHQQFTTTQEPPSSPDLERRPYGDPCPWINASDDGDKRVA
jgi:hypothetical protein